jgi:hypothetical protein
MSNPFTHPTKSAAEFNDHLRRVATYHRWIVLLILTYIGFSFLLVFFWRRIDIYAIAPYWLLPIVAYVILLIMIAPLALLTKEWTNNSMAILCCLLLLAPYGEYLLLPMLILFHVLAIRYLRRNGVAVGLLGANPKRI